MTDTDFKRLLILLGRHSDEPMSRSTITPDGFRSRMGTVADAIRIAASKLASRDCYYSTGILRADLDKGRGFERDVIGVRELFADLDVKPGGLASYDDARTVIDRVSTLLGVRPVGVVATGGGLQPHWPLEPQDWADADDPRWLEVKVVFRRFGRLVAAEAEKVGGKVDSVYDLSRVLRVPGTVNRKYDPPRPVTADFNGTAEATMVPWDRLINILDAEGIAVFDEDSHAIGEIISPPAGWTWAPEGTWCRYVETMATGWKDEKVGGRHPWLYSKAVRLATTHRLGLVTEAQYLQAAEALTDRFLVELDRPGDARNPHPGEIALVLADAQSRAAAKTDAEALAEFDGHVHDGDVFRSDGCAVPVAETTEVEQEQTAGEAKPAEPALAPLNPAIFFTDRGALRVDKLTRYLLKRQPCLLTAEGHLAFYRNGAYRVDRESLNHELARLLRDKYRKEHVSTVGSYVKGLLAFTPEYRLPDLAPQAMFCVANGTIDLATKELVAWDPKHLLANQSPIRWDPDAKCPKYLAWARNIKVIDIVDDLEEAFAQMLDPTRTPAKSPFLYGPTRSGKSTFLRLMQRIAGPDGYSAVTLHELAEDRFLAASVYGKILNAAADLSERHVVDLSKFRLLTGQDPVTAQRKFEHDFKFTNRAVFAFSANDPPTVEDSEAYYARVVPFRFSHSFRGHEDPRIEREIITEELPGILVRLVDAWQRIQARGGLRETTKETTKDFAARSSRVYEWVSTECVIHEIPPKGTNAERPKIPTNQAETLTTLLNRFNAWAGPDRKDHLGRNTFARRLTSIDGVRRVVFGDAAVEGYNVTRVPFGGD
jgi:P4 family phage/plasmid primase-like protien